MLLHDPDNARVCSQPVQQLESLRWCWGQHWQLPSLIPLERVGPCKPGMRCTQMKSFICAAQVDPLQIAICFVCSRTSTGHCCVSGAWEGCRQDMQATERHCFLEGILQQGAPCITAALGTHKPLTA